MKTEFLKKLGLEQSVIVTCLATLITTVNRISTAACLPVRNPADAIISSDWFVKRRKQE